MSASVENESKIKRNVSQRCVEVSDRGYIKGRAEQWLDLGTYMILYSIFEQKWQ